MRTISLVAALAAASLSFGQTGKMNQTGPSGVDREYDAAYRPSSETTIVGTVKGKVKGSPGRGMAEDMSIIVVTKKRGLTYQVDMGPTWFVGEQSTKINVGDRVKVVGDEITFDKNDEHVFLARQIVRGKEVLALRDMDGQPYWMAFHKGNVRVAGSENSVSGQITAQNTVKVGNESDLAYQLQTSNGLINIAAAPNWFLEQQGLGFKVGDTITVYTGVGPVNYNGVILANGIYGSGYGGTVVLRPNGLPVWGGWTNYIGPGY